MALFTLAEATEYFTAAKTAYKAALSGRSYEIKDRKLARQSIKELKKEMNKWGQYIEDLENGDNPDRSIIIRRGFAVGI